MHFRQKPVKTTPPDLSAKDPLTGNQRRFDQILRQRGVARVEPTFTFPAPRGGGCPHWTGQKP